MQISESNVAQRSWRDWFAGLSVERIALVLGLVTLVVAAVNPLFKNTFLELWSRGLLIGCVLMLAYTLAGNWPQTYVARWHVQILAVVLLAPLCAVIEAIVDTHGNIDAVLNDRHRVAGFFWVLFLCLGVGLIATLVALVREREALANAQALRFALEKETLERQALDAQLRVMTAQIEPHFLLNTLANVQALVETGSARAAPVLRSLIGYLRAALPRLRESEGTLGGELALARAYLDVMQMRIPDRLQFDIAVPAELESVRFPSMALLTLVENAVRHGIDPAEQGGRIEIGARREGDGLRVWVGDSGVGLNPSAPPGSGLANLKQRLAAFYGPGARLDLLDGDGRGGRGLRAEVVLPSTERRA
ncbi:histidine kinase [uncultured Methylibium sp.]|uniref:sensor histidine kinase n=1 Tax=uncultured Methylibium sp. TaxID=381093 RepID=UPI0025FFA668|nr:histidine kinase [uncultured Methylibium sp.]